MVDDCCLLLNVLLLLFPPLVELLSNLYAYLVLCRAAWLDACDRLPMLAERAQCLDELDCENEMYGIRHSNILPSALIHLAGNGKQSLFRV